MIFCIIGVAVGGIKKLEINLIIKDEICQNQ